MAGDEKLSQQTQNRGL